MRRIAAALLLGGCLPTTAQAACPQELAVYAQSQGSAGIDFRPSMHGGAETASFRLVLGKSGIVLDGSVMRRDDGAERSYGLVTHQCPDGDATGAELDACVIWQGTIYAVNAEGEIGSLPAQRMPAAERLILADFGPAVGQSRLYEEGGSGRLPWDVFQLSGCQE